MLFLFLFQGTCSSKISFVLALFIFLQDDGNQHYLHGSEPTARRYRVSKPKCRQARCRMTSNGISLKGGENEHLRLVPALELASCSLIVSRPFFPSVLSSFWFRLLPLCSRYSIFSFHFPPKINTELVIIGLIRQQKSISINGSRTHNLILLRCARLKCRGARRQSPRGTTESSPSLFGLRSAFLFLSATLPPVLQRGAPSSRR